MSRSNPQENTNPNPSTRWFEWQGELGTIRYFDKDSKKNIDLGSDFAFVLLDQLGGVRGWHEPSSSGIYSNEVKDTRQDVLIVKSFKGGAIAEGLYKDIKDRVNSAGGQFNANCYCAYKGDDGVLALGCLRFKGAALAAWMEFCKTNRAELYTRGVRITGAVEAKKGRITFRVPTLKLVDLTPESNAAAVALDEKLQAYLSGYLKKTKREQVDSAAQHHPPDDAEFDQRTPPPPLSAEDIPF